VSEDRVHENLDEFATEANDRLDDLESDVETMAKNREELAKMIGQQNQKIAELEAGMAHLTTRTIPGLVALVQSRMPPEERAEFTSDVEDNMSAKLPTAAELIES